MKTLLRWMAPLVLFAGYPCIAQPTTPLRLEYRLHSDYGESVGMLINKNTFCRIAVHVTVEKRRQRELFPGSDRVGDAIFGDQFLDVFVLRAFKESCPDGTTRNATGEAIVPIGLRGVTDAGTPVQMTVTY